MKKVVIIIALAFLAALINWLSSLKPNLQPDWGHHFHNTRLGLNESQERQAYDEYRRIVNNDGPIQNIRTLR